MMKSDIYTNAINSIESIHMKQRTMGLGLAFVLKSREAKDRHIELQFKNGLNELLGDASHYGSETILESGSYSQKYYYCGENVPKRQRQSSKSC